MALIICPECQKEVSEKADKCIHCGYPLNSSNTETSDEKLILNVQPEMQKVEIASVNIRGKNLKKTVLSLLIIISIVLGGFYVFNQVTTQNSEKKFVENAKAVNELMLSGGSTAETVTYLLKKIWYNAIHEEYDYETDEYALIAGEFVEDFNTALFSYQLSENYVSNVALMESNMSEVQELIKSLQNPPEKFVTVYSTISDLYSTYTSLMDNAIDPAGSYNSYVEDVSNNIDEFMKLYKKVESQLP